MTDLARLPSYPSPTTLIARSGIQFLDFGFDPVRLKVREWGFHDAAAAKAVDDLVQLDFDEARGQYEVVEAGRRRAAEPNLVVTAKDALAPFLDKWVPVPFLQVRPNNQFREGPADWARVRVVDLEARYGAGYRDEQGNRYRAVLAFDTGLIAEAEGRAYLAPSPKDVTSGALFALAPQQRANHWLLRQDWMSQWLEELFRELHPRATLEEIDGDIKQKPQEATARYLAFLGLLAEAAHFPPIKLVGDAERPGRGAIEVDLVLDVGNSRTCGLLIEAAGELGVNLNDSYELALRDLSHPESVHTKPFESRVEFAQAWFGKNHLSRLGGRADAFVWPTMTRVGPEATRLAARRRGTEGNTGMSSPKRYLWDEEPQTPRMALQRRLRPGPDGDAGRRRADGAARQPEGRAAAPGRSRCRLGRPPAGVRAALLALLDDDLRAVGDPAAGADADELAAAARPARPCRDAAPAAPHRAHAARPACRWPSA